MRAESMLAYSCIANQEKRGKSGHISPVLTCFLLLFLLAEQQITVDCTMSSCV